MMHGHTNVRFNGVDVFVKFETFSPNYIPSYMSKI